MVKQNISNKKEDPMDIENIINKIDKLPIQDADKASLLNQIKLNMMNPSHGEDENLNRIQSKYMQQPQHILEQLPPATTPSPHLYQLPQSQYFPIQPIPYPQMQQQLMQGNMMTTAHFEILKNKLDAVQLELVDLLRHVKDYTQRYMNATRQQDMEKIDAYVNGLFEVDKKMKEADEKAKEYEAEADAEEEPETRQSLIGKATSGIKNFIGSIGDNVAGVATMVSNTANIANGYLSKKVIGSDTSNASPQQASSTINSNQSNKNIVSVDDYIRSNMNEMEGTTNNSNTPNNNNTNNLITSNMNNILKTNSITTKKPTENTKPTETTEAKEDDITNAIKKLNDTMNEDINNTVLEGEKNLNTSTQNTQNKLQSGGRREQQLTKKIKLLKLKLTKNKLENEIKKHTKLNNIKLNNINSKHNKNKSKRK
jgi:hypothetical protein